MRSLHAFWSILLTITVTSLARFAEAEPRMSVVGGLGVTVSGVAEEPGQPEVEGTGIGGFAEASYYHRFSDWVRPMAYAGLVLTVPQKNCGPSVTECDVSAQFLFAGGQIRLIAPIPYVGLFLETGVGASVGNFSTRSGDWVNEELTGVTYHIPLALGVMLGERHQYQLALRYLVHPGLQVSGGFALGLDFPLENPEPEEPVPSAPALRLQRPPGWEPGDPASP